MSISKKYSAFLFDVDGTLLDTITLIYESFKNTLALFNYGSVTREEIFSQVGQPLPQSILHFFPFASEEQVRTIMDAHMSFQMSVYKKYVKAYPNTIRLLTEIKKAGVLCGIVTSRRHESLDVYLSATGIQEYFDVVITPESTTKHKPDPEPALMALSLLGAHKEETLMVGDSWFDIDCGSSAGIDTCFVSWSYSTTHDLHCKPTMVISDFSELVPHIFLCKDTGHSV